MSESEKRSLRQRFEAFQPTKTMLLWACAGSVVATIIAGFAFGGWVTGGTAQQMASAAGEDARVELAAVICVENFLAAPNAQAQLAELRDISSAFQQRQYIEGGEWAVMPDRDSANRQVAAQCAQLLSQLELPQPAPDEIIEH